MVVIGHLGKIFGKGLNYFRAENGVRSKIQPCHSERSVCGVKNLMNTRT